MAAINEQFSNVTDSLFGGGLTIVVWIVIGFFGIAIGGAAVWYFFNYRKKFDIMVKIISRRSGENRIFFDRGAILRDKKKNTDYLRLWNSKIELEMPKFNIMHNTNKGDYLELLRESERGFRFLTPPKIDSKYLLKYNGKLYPIAKLKQYQIENDLSWILERQKVNKSLINPEGIFAKILDNAPHIIAMAFSFFMLWIIFRFAPQMLDSLRQLVAELKTPATVEVIGGIIPALMFGVKKW